MCCLIIFQTIRALVYVDDVKHSGAGYKTSLTMWSLCSGPIQQEFLGSSVPIHSFFMEGKCYHPKAYKEESPEASTIHMIQLGLRTKCAVTGFRA
jgi:hypothetical protein